ESFAYHLEGDLRLVDVNGRQADTVHRYGVADRHASRDRTGVDPEYAAPVDVVSRDDGPEVFDDPGEHIPDNASGWRWIPTRAATRLARLGLTDGRRRSPLGRIRRRSPTPPPASVFRFRRRFFRPDRRLRRRSAVAATRRRRVGSLLRRVRRGGPNRPTRLRRVPGRGGRRDRPEPRVTWPKRPGG